MSIFGPSPADILQWSLRCLIDATPTPADADYFDFGHWMPFSAADI